MEENKKQEQKLPKREKSALYPFYTLEESIEFIKAIQRIAGKGITTEDSLASEMGVSKTTKSFQYGISTAKQYGLIVKTKEGLHLTDRGRTIINPVDETEIPELLKESFQLPPLYKKLIKRYEGYELPKKESLANLMYNDLNIAGSAKNRATKIFLDNITFLNLQDSDGRFNLNLELDESDLDDEGNNNEIDTLITQSPGLQLPLTPKPEEGKKIQYATYQIALAGERDARIIVPRDTTHKDIERIKNLIDLLIIDEVE